MFAEFGPAPLCLELDFDTFEGPPHWVVNFRRMSGWLMVAKATIQSEHDILTAKLIAACDEAENPIPAFRARHLTECCWSSPKYCAEQPPEVLDDLICEQEGELIRRWHREKNAGLAEAFEAQEQRIAELEGKVRSAVRRNERRIAELRQRRRHPSATPDIRMQLGEIIRELGQESDSLVGEMAVTRGAIRERAAAYEETLWARDDLLVEVEPLHLVQWYSKPRSKAGNKRQTIGGPGLISIRGIHQAELVEREQRLARERTKQAKESAEREALLAKARKDNEAVSVCRKVPSYPRPLGANPILLATLEGRVARMKRELAQPDLQLARAAYLRTQVATLSKRIARLQPRTR